MFKRLGVILLWLLATVGTASLTYAAVTQADRAVGVAPAGPVSGADIAAQIATTTAATPDSTVAPIATTTTTVPATGVTTTTLVTTTAAPSPTTTAASTTTSASHEWKTVPGVGTVGVSVAGTTVTLISASPVAPYSVEVEDDGPEKVEVKFHAGSTEYRVRAEVSAGRLVWDVSQEEDDD